MRAASLLALLIACSDGGTSSDSIPLGSNCAQGGDGACSGGRCFVLDDQTAYCTRACSSAAECPPEYSCQRTPALGQVCLLRRAGGACEVDGDCPAGHKCDALAHTCYIPVSRTLCAPCTSDKQCPANGSCLRIAATEEHFCTQSCGGGEACPAGFECREVGKNSPQCVPPALSCDEGKGLCAPCKGDNECGDARDLCVENLVSHEKFCGRDCAGGGACPGGFNCSDLSGVGTGPHQCVPNALTCAGYCDEPDAARSERQCGLGRVCDPAAHACAGALDGRLCAPCQDDDGCGDTPGAHCVSNKLTGESFCGADCTLDANAGCPSAGCAVDQTKCTLGFTCIALGNNSGPPFQCVPDRGTCLAGTGRLGDDCTAAGADQCLTGQCLELGPVSICTQSCASADECGGSYLCCAKGASIDCSRGPTSSEQGVCVPGSGRFGADCSPGQAPCLSGLCLDMGTARVCTNGCTPGSGTGCLTGFHCEEAIAADGSNVGVCFPDGGGGPGADCTFGPAACQGRLCIKKDSGNICSLRCDANDDCPQDWACAAATTVEDASIQACVPAALIP